MIDDTEHLLNDLMCVMLVVKACVSTFFKLEVRTEKA